MKNTIIKILSAIMHARDTRGMTGNFEMDSNGDLEVYFEGENLSTFDMCPEGIYVRIMDKIVSYDLEREEADIQ